MIVEFTTSFNGFVSLQLSGSQKMSRHTDEEPSSTMSVQPDNADIIVSTEETHPPPPPDGGYGWICVAAQFLINGFTWGVAAV